MKPSRRAIHDRTPNGALSFFDAAWRYRAMGKRREMRLLAKDGVAFWRRCPQRPRQLTLF